MIIEVDYFELYTYFKKTFKVTKKIESFKEYEIF
jgi:hypothetical protein